LLAWKLGQSNVDIDKMLCICLLSAVLESAAVLHLWSLASFAPTIALCDVHKLSAATLPETRLVLLS